MCDENNLPSDIAGAPFSNITDRNGNVIPGAGYHGIFPYARTSHFEINGGYSYVRTGIRLQPAQGHDKSLFVARAATVFWQAAYGWECG